LGGYFPQACTKPEKDAEENREAKPDYLQTRLYI
jgi:hypothetical protein